MPTNNSIKWFKNGRFGDLGWAAPYGAKNKFYSNNNAISSLVNKGGELLFAIAQQPDVNVATPPTIYFLKSLGKAVDRLEMIIDSETVASGQVENRSVGINPTPEEFLIYPIPYFRVRNRWAKRWFAYGLMALSEAMKHQDNSFSLQIHPDLAGIIKMYTGMIRQQIAVQFLGIDVVAAKLPGFKITDDQYAAYAPNNVFLLSERVDTGAPVSWTFSSEDLYPLSQGVAASTIYPLLTDWPIPGPQTEDEPFDPTTIALPDTDQSSAGTKVNATAATASSVSTPPGP